MGLKLNLGAGRRRLEGFLSVDSIAYPETDVVCDLLDRWPWDDGSVELIGMAHLLEHFTGRQRVFILNEMYRVLQPGGKVNIITPHWQSIHAYGDFTHQWPPVTIALYLYTLKSWRMANAEHLDISVNRTGYDCDFTSEYQETKNELSVVLTKI
jgi:ubiquinone/menaquinone biosynthesis C-methylase UbiE